MSRASQLIEAYQAFTLDEASIDIDAIKKLGQEILNFDDSKMPQFIEWIAHFPKSGRAPKGEKKLFDSIKFLHTQAEVYQSTGLLSPNISATFSWWDEAEMDRVADVFFAGKTKAKLEVITHGNVTFHNGSSMSEVRFVKTSKTVAALLKSLKGYHKKAISKPLEIHFKSAKDIKAKAVYKGLLDQVWIRDNSKADNELYGHLLYIVVHELGHRFDKLHRIPRDFADSDFYTTDYSHADSMAGSECFAEIFAISHWPDKYKEYADQIERFNKLMK
jgi:hypothetical protein